MWMSACGALGVLVDGIGGEGRCWGVGTGVECGGGVWGRGVSYFGGQGRLGFGVILARRKYLGYTHFHGRSGRYGLFRSLYRDSSGNIHIGRWCSKTACSVEEAATATLPI